MSDRASGRVRHLAAQKFEEKTVGRNEARKDAVSNPEAPVKELLDE
jgi:hypothetical protein